MEIEAGKPVQIEKKDTIDILGVNQGIDWATATISCQPKLEQLLEEDQDTREFLNQLSSALGTKESIAAQRRMEKLTSLTLAVALGSMVIAILAALSS